MSDVDWKAIRTEYEQGASLRSLAAKHGVSKSVIGERKFKERWVEHRTDTVRTPDRIPLSRPTPLSLPADALSIARIGLSQLAQHLQAEDLLPISSHKSLSDALAQYVKVLIVAPREAEVQDVLSIPLNKISPRTRLAIQRLLDEDEQEQEQEQVS